MKTYTAKPKDITRQWYVVDATDRTLGRLATKVAEVLQGKHKATYTPNIDMGDFVVVVNASKVKLTGDKLAKKSYFRHSGYPGGEKHISYEKLMAEKPEFVIEKAVKGMLPSTKLGRAMFKKLKVYSGAEHQHEAQSPKPLTL
jgi:large subunit ribosomal protein L13